MPTGISRALPVVPTSRAGAPPGVLLHIHILPISAITHSTPAACGRSLRALESVWMHEAAWGCRYAARADSRDIETGAAGAVTSTPSPIWRWPDRGLLLTPGAAQISQKLAC